MRVFLIKRGKPPVLVTRRPTLRWAGIASAASVSSSIPSPGHVSSTMRDAAEPMRPPSNQRSRLRQTASLGVFSTGRLRLWVHARGPALQAGPLPMRGYPYTSSSARTALYARGPPLARGTSHSASVSRSVDERCGIRPGVPTGVAPWLRAREPYRQGSGQPLKNAVVHEGASTDLTCPYLTFRGSRSVFQFCSSAAFASLPITRSSETRSRQSTQSAPPLMPRSRLGQPAVVMCQFDALALVRLA